MTEDEYIAFELNRVATMHPDIAFNQETFLHYQQCVLNTGDFDAGYEQFARDQEVLAMEANRGPTVTLTATERAAGAVGRYLDARSKGLIR